MTLNGNSSLSDFSLDSDPKRQFLRWYQDAVQSGMKNPEAMTLATASLEGVPSARIVLYKGMDEEGGLRFFTNYHSRKGHELGVNSRAAVVFYWSQLDRQVRIEGEVKRLSAEESDIYWKSRPRESQVGALASAQSQSIPNRDSLLARYRDIEEMFKNEEIPRPGHWGGYVLMPNRFEFWLGQESRLHDRFYYAKKGNIWELGRLAP